MHFTDTISHTFYDVQITLTSTIEVKLAPTGLTPSRKQYVDWSYFPELSRRHSEKAIQRPPVRLK